MSHPCGCSSALILRIRAVVAGVFRLPTVCFAPTVAEAGGFVLSLRGSGRFFYVAEVFSFRVKGGLKLPSPPLRVVGDSKVFVYCRLRVSEPCRVLTSPLHPPLRGWPNSWSSDQCIGRRPTAALDNMTYVFRCGCFNGKDGPSLWRGLSLVARLRLSYTPRLS